MKREVACFDCVLFFLQLKNVSEDAVQGKIGKIYMPDQKVRVTFIHLAVIASTMTS